MKKIIALDKKDLERDLEEIKKDEKYKGRLESFKHLFMNIQESNFFDLDFDKQLEFVKKFPKNN